MSLDNEKHKSPKVPTKIDTRFVVGLFLIIFLVFMYTKVAEFPVWLVAIPAFFMGFDVVEIVRLWKGGGDNKK